MKRSAWVIGAFLIASACYQYWIHAHVPPSDSDSSLEKGSAAPALRLPYLDGATFDLEEQRGQVVIIDFWATWCGPCQTEFEMLEDWWNRERARGTVDSVQVVAVNVGEDVEIVRSFVERRKLPFRVMLDADMSAAQAFGVTALPTLVVIDRAGRIVEVEVGFTPKVGFNLNKALLKMELGPAP